MESFYQERQLFVFPSTEWVVTLVRRSIGQKSNWRQHDRDRQLPVSFAPKSTKDQRGIKFERNHKGGGKDRYLISVITCPYRVVRVVVEKVLPKVSVIFCAPIPFKIDT